MFRLFFQVLELTSATGAGAVGIQELVVGVADVVGVGEGGDVTATDTGAEEIGGGVAGGEVGALTG